MHSTPETDGLLSPHAVVRVALVSIWALGIVITLRSPSVAKDSAPTERWVYAPDIGFEGAASITDGKSSRMEMECGNGGGPAIELKSPAIKGIISRGRDDLHRLLFEIDGNRITERYSCYPKNSLCLSFGFPSLALTKSLRQGKNLVIRYKMTVLASFTLSGSKAAITRLSSCLGPEVY